jgi:hypothetical protein
MFLGLNEISDDRFFAQRLAGFQAVQPMHEDETIAVAPHQNGGFLPALQHALGNLLDYLGLEGRTTFDRNIDICDFEFLPLHHGRTRSFQFGRASGPARSEDDGGLGLSRRFRAQLIVLPSPSTSWLAARRAGGGTTRAIEVRLQWIGTLNFPRIPIDLETRQQLDIACGSASGLHADAKGLVTAGILGPVLLECVQGLVLVGKACFLVAAQHDRSAAGSLTARSHLQDGWDAASAAIPRGSRLRSGWLLGLRLWLRLSLRLRLLE